MAGERHIWEGKIGRNAKWFRDAVGFIVDTFWGKTIRITVEVLENGGGGVEEASRREV